MGKKEKSGDLGRALVKHHNQMVQQSKEKSRVYSKQHKRVLESFTEVGDIEAVVEQAEEADLIYASDHPIPNVLSINLDTSSSGNDLSPEETREQQKMEEALHASSLRVPRRPPWNANMTVEELETNERQAFLFWRRNLARLEENEKLVLTPFEKNLDIWRQLWRVLERSDLLVMVVDARDPLFYRCPDLEAYACEINEHKRTLLLINKADLLPSEVRQSWADYFHNHGILFLFWSAKAASAALEGKKLISPWAQDSSSANTDIKIYGRDELLARLQAEAEAIAVRASGVKDDSPCHSPSCSAGSSSSRHVVVGFVGYPNVGKSSTINALVGQKRTGVTSTPGKTKHFQTLIISDQLVLCDCPGLVFPSFSSSRYEMAAAGVLPIDRMTEHREAVQVVANRVPRQTIEAIYNISLPKPKPYEDRSRPPLAAELLRAYCSSRGYVSSSGLPDETRAARQILKDYIDGKLPHYEMPPATSAGGYEVDREDENVLGDDSESDSSVVEDHVSPAGEAVGIAHGHELSHILNDLDSFDTPNEATSLPRAAIRKNKPAAAASHKHHRKPQRKKDRSWRVDNDGSDGTPVVRVFQKPINIGPMKAG